MIRAGTLIAALLLAMPQAPLQAAGAEPAERIPSVGLDGPYTDGCAAVGRVTGLDPTGDYFLAVRALPDAASREKDRLDPTVLVWLCEAEGAWQGVVYAPKGKDFGDCRVSNSLAFPEPYAGPCLYGWVEGHYIQLTAG